MHEPDHPDDESGGNEHHPAFENVLVEVEVGDDDGNADAGRDGCAEGVKDRPLELAAVDFIEIGEDDSDDQRCFDTFAQRDDKSL